MKRINILARLGLFIALFNIGCNNLVDMQPLNEISDANFWTSPDQFKLAANEFYTYLRSFTEVMTDGPHSETRADFTYQRDGANLFSNGNNTVPLTDGNWNYARIRNVNYLLEKADSYPAPDDIKTYVAEARFFRAYLYFDLLQQYGGVPIIDKPLTVSSAELSAPRNTRDQVADFIISDLDAAIAALPTESAVAALDKGRISKEAAQSFLSRVALCEGTWQQNRGNSGRANTLLDKAIAASSTVMTGNQFALFAPAVLGDSAQKYLFVLEDQTSNPAGLAKSANKEYILKNRYEFALRQIRFNVTKTVVGNVFVVTKKFADLYLSQDGLPIEKSPLFKGYASTTSEFQNRDNRMRYNLLRDGQTFWTNNSPRVSWKGDAADIASGQKWNAATGSGYANQKWGTERKLSDNEEAYDYPVIRYAEVLLNYAEALYERNGSISNQDLDKSLNLVRNRVNKTMPKLSNELVAANGLDMRTEIRRERNIELYFEGFRRDDLIRWKTAETEMKQDILGITWKGTAFETRWPGISAQVVNGVYRLETNRKWVDKNYLLPVPSQQIQLNPNLEQNPGW